VNESQTQTQPISTACIQLQKNSMHKQTYSTIQCIDCIGLCSVLRPRQHSIGYTGDTFYNA